METIDIARARASLDAAMQHERTCDALARIDQCTQETLDRARVRVIEARDALDAVLAAAGGTMCAVEIKTAPHQQWFLPGGCGPYHTRAEADDAASRARDLWMDARVIEIDPI